MIRVGAIHIAAAKHAIIQTRAANSSALSKLLKRMREEGGTGKKTATVTKRTARIRIGGSAGVGSIVGMGILEGMSGLGGAESIASEETPAATKKTRTRKSMDAKDALTHATSTVSEVMAIRAAHPDHVLLVQMGGFYELYEYCTPDLDMLADALNLTVSSPPNTFRRAGFPLHQIERYVSRLASAGGGLRRSVAIVDQVAKDHLSPGKNFTRAVTRIVTPGTPLPTSADSVADTNENCFLLSLIALPSTETNEPLRIGLSWTDINTGEFAVFESSLETLLSDLTRIAPTEIVCNLKEDLPPAVASIVQQLSDLQSVHITYRGIDLFDPPSCIAKAVKVQQRIYPIESLRGSLQNTSLEESIKLKPNRVRYMNHDASEASVAAAGALFGYLNEIFCGFEPHFHFNSNTVSKQGATMHIDAATMASLEIVKTMRDHEKRGSLLSEMDQTKTAQGFRLLASRLKSPSTELQEIQRRHAVIESFCEKTQNNLLETTQSYLSKIRDMERCLQRVHLQSAKPRDVLNLLQSMEVADSLRTFLRNESSSLLQSSDLLNVVEKIALPMDLVQTYKNVFSDALALSANGNGVGEDEVVDEDGSKNDGFGGASRALSGYSRGKFQTGIIGRGISVELDNLRAKLESYDDQESNLKAMLTRQYGVEVILSEDAKEGPCVSVPSGKAGVNAAALTMIQSDKLVEALRRQTLVTKHKFKHTKWTKLFEERKMNEEAIIRAETAIFEECCDSIRAKSSEIIATAEAVAEIDVSASMALIASQWNYVKPNMVDEVIVDVKDARHPVVENMQILRAQTFTVNDLYLDPETRVYIMTGPNMGGKSTFLRQSAILSIMAQAGLYVPASSARLGVMDAVYSRVGASDNLAGNQSTFRVEMEETAHILLRATNRSLVIMDEVGRGTSSQDGLALACGIIKRVLHVNKSLCLFATHYHELPLLLAYQLGGSVAKQEQEQFNIPGAKCVKTTIKFGDNGEFTYSYSVEEGVSDRSYGIEAARLAGLPSDVIQESIKLQRILMDVRKRDEDLLAQSFTQ
ncbi:muts domain V-domain-containing protein [Chytriomyces cf. hyalinus JEL632]|nr:muts domain V-domain-containing protein [Chytriomyces cf. hyalinus JEL632]